MIANDPTLYGATLPNRELPFMNPYFVPQIPWGLYGQQFPLFGQQFPLYGQQLPLYGQQLPLYGQQLPWMTHGRFVPPVFPTEGMHGVPPFVANRYFPQLPWAPVTHGLGTLPYKWQVPFTY